MIEAVTWVIKYFKADSAWYLFFFKFIKGINTNILISIINQVINQVFVDIISKVENNIIVKNEI